MGKLLKSIGVLAAIFLGLYWNSPPADAAVIVAASASYADVNAAVTSASNGDTVQVPLGTATWSSTLNLGTKTISLIGAGIGSTIITNGVGCLIKSNNTGNGLVRISGFRFNSSDNQNPIVNFAGPSYKVRVDHCYFNKGDSAIGTNNFQGGTGTGPVYGVTDHCQFYNMKRAYFAMDVRSGESSWGTAAWAEFTANPSSFPGSDKMMYFENNQFVWDGNFTDQGGQTALYGGYGGKCCFRYNTTTGYDWVIDAHGDSPDQSTVYYEIYNNTFTYGNILIQGFGAWQRGGQWIVHDNTFANYTSIDTIHLSVYWETDAEAHRVHNTYFWGNSVNGNSNQSAIVSIVDSGQTSPGYSAAHIILNQNYFLHAPQSGQTYYPYVPLTYPHPLAGPGGTPSPTPTATATATGTPISTPSPSPTPTATPLGLSFPAPAGLITDPFVISGNNVSQPIDTSDPTLGGRAFYVFSVPVSGDYQLVALVNCPDGGSNSVFVNVDAEPSSSMIWSITPTSGFEQRIAAWYPSTTPQVWTLNAGVHQLVVRGREANTLLQRFTFSIPPQPPQGLHVVP